MQRIDVQSKLTAVTVYKDRAQLTHTSTVDIPNEGEFSLVFDKGMWTDVDRNTLQVSLGKGADAVKLRSVLFRTITFIEDIRLKKREKETLVETLQKEMDGKSEAVARHRRGED